MPFHVVVLRRGHIFKLTPFHAEDNTMFNIDELHEAFKQVKSCADRMPRGPGIGALTADYRDKWAKNRTNLLSLGIPGKALIQNLRNSVLLPLIGQDNKEALEAIETAMFYYSLDEACPTSTSDCCRLACIGDTENRQIHKDYIKKNCLFGN